MNNLKSLLLPEKVVTFDFPGCDGLTFDLAYLSKDEVQKISKECTTSKFNRKTRQKEDDIDADKFLEIYVERTVKGWKGFKLKYLNEFVLVDLSKEDKENEIEYTPETALELMQNSAIFDGWVSDQISDLGNFNSDNSKKNSNPLKDL